MDCFVQIFEGHLDIIPKGCIKGERKDRYNSAACNVIYKNPYVEVAKIPNIKNAG